MRTAYSVNIDAYKKAGNNTLIIQLGNYDDLPTAFNGKAQCELYYLYGDPRMKGWGNRWIQIWNIQQKFPWFPAKKIFVHKDFRVHLQNALQALEKKGLHKEIKTFDGCYKLCYAHGSSSLLSVHSWGAAIDVNAADNTIGSDGQWSPEFIEVMEHHAIYCGQSWSGRKEPMHFAMVNG